MDLFYEVKHTSLLSIHISGIRHGRLRHNAISRRNEERLRELFLKMAHPLLKQREREREREKEETAHIICYRLELGQHTKITINAMEQLIIFFTKG